MATSSTSSLLERCHFPPAGTSVTCAVSGGPDSLALLVLATEARCDVTVVHVDHGLRPGSALEADVVREAANRFGARFESRAACVDPGPNLEARARLARYAALPPDVLTGHTADDQAETILLNLVRGAGLDGLRGMPVSHRPLIRLRRRETRRLCDELGLSPIVDPSNSDLSLRRNRIRHDLLPLLDDIACRDVVDVMSRQAELLSDDAALLEALSEAIDPTDAASLRAAPLPLARRAVRRWLRADADAEHHPPDAATVDRVLSVARGDVRSTEVGGRRRVTRSRGRLTIEDL